MAPSQVHRLLSLSRPRSVEGPSAVFVFLATCAFSLANRRGLSFKVEVGRLRVLPSDDRAV